MKHDAGAVKGGTVVKRAGNGNIALEVETDWEGSIAVYYDGDPDVDNPGVLKTGECDGRMEGTGVDTVVAVGSG